MGHKWIQKKNPGEPPSASSLSAEPATAIEDDATIMENEPPTKPRVADPSFKEMPCTLTSPDDPGALATCM